MKTIKKSSISYLRIFSTVSVLCSHVASTLVLNDFEMTSNQLCFFNTMMYLLKFGVPTFVIITGSLLLQSSREISYSICLKKYVSRMILAILIFGIPFAFLVVFFNDRSLQSFSIGRLLVMVLNNEGLSHLWYLFLMIGLYLIMPFVKIFTENCSIQLLRYILVVLFVLNSVIPLINDAFGMNIQLLPQVGMYVFYLLLGFYLCKEHSSVRSCIISSVIIFCVIALVIITVITGGSADLIMRYSSPFNCLFSASIFILFNYIRNEATEKIWKIDRLCFGVYLIHPVFIQFSYRYLKITPVCSWYIFAYIVFCLIICVLSFCGSWIMSLIKPLKKYVI